MCCLRTECVCVCVLACLKGEEKWGKRKGERRGKEKVEKRRRERGKGVLKYIMEGDDPNQVVQYDIAAHMIHVCLLVKLGNI